MAEVKLTNRDLAEIFYMILEGNSVRDAAEKFGVSHQRIYKKFDTLGFDFKCNKNYRVASRYPNIAKWLNDHKYNERNLAEKAGVSYSTINKFLNGKQNLRRSNIQKILYVTGLTYEEAFATEIKESEE